MTPAERARQIDKEEFEAECAAFRIRALGKLGLAEVRDDRVSAWINRDAPQVAFVPKNAFSPTIETCRRAKIYTAYGRSHTLKEWALATGMTVSTIRNRLAIGWEVEDAVSRRVQVHLKPGVSSDFAPSKGTGGGRHA